LTTSSRSFGIFKEIISKYTLYKSIPYSPVSKKIVLVLFCIVSSVAFGQQPLDADGKTWVAPYFLDAPDGWVVERFPIPIDFAPQIPYKGIEDIRFSPGWGNRFADEYWTYCFLWYLDGKPEITKETIQRNTELYFAGLIGRNVEKRMIPPNKIFKPVTAFMKITAWKGDLVTYIGTIYMLDYQTQKPITLNCIVHSKSCSALSEKAFLFFEFSPKPIKDDVWVQMEKIWAKFKCSN